MVNVYRVGSQTPSLKSQRIGRIDMDGRVYDLPFDEIQRAKLLMTDALLAQASAGGVQN